MQSWKDNPPKAPKEKATADLLQSLRSTPTLSPEALARIGRRVRAEAHAPGSRWVSVLAGLRLPALAGALGSVAIVGGLTYVALERRPVVELPGADRVAVAPAGPLEIEEPTPSMAATPPPSPVTAKAARPAVHAKDERAVAPDPSRARAQPFPGTAAGGGAAKLEESASADRDSLGIGARRDKASDSVGASQGAGAPEPAFAERKMAATPSATRADSSLRPAPSANSGFAGAPPPPSAASRMAASDEASEAPMTKEREQPAAAAPRDDAVIVDSAEQLAGTGRCADAIVPFSIVADSGGSGPLVERALFGRARCRLTLHQEAAAREDLQAYLTRFPDGRYAPQARGLLR